MALVNGSPMKIFSLSFHDQEEHDQVERLVNTKDFEEEVAVEEPLAVNMTIVESLDNKPISTKQKNNLMLSECTSL